MVNRTVSKPCTKLGYCPYGALVELYPFSGGAKKYTELSCWTGNRAIITFGHDCPVHYQAEFVKKGATNPRSRNQIQSVFGITPITKRAKKWIKTNVSTEPWQWLGPTLVVEHRYIADLTAGMLEAGLIVNKDFRVG